MKCLSCSRLRRLLPVIIHLVLFSQVHGLCMEDCTLVLESPLPNSIFRVGMVSVIFYSHGNHCNETEMWVDVEVFTPRLLTRSRRRLVAPHLIQCVCVCGGGIAGGRGGRDPAAGRLPHLRQFHAPHSHHRPPQRHTVPRLRDTRHGIQRRRCQRGLRQLSGAPPPPAPPPAPLEPRAAPRLRAAPRRSVTAAAAAAAAAAGGAADEDRAGDGRGVCAAAGDQVHAVGGGRLPRRGALPARVVSSSTCKSGEQLYLQEW
jgi:hypothetical protein